MLVYALVALFVVGSAANVTSIVMKLRVNDELPEDERFSWWERDATAVRRKYQEFHPDSSLPHLDRYATWVFISLLVVAVTSSFFQK